MIDKALLGAIERALERNEPKEFIKHSLASNNYSSQEIEEAINLVIYRKQLQQSQQIAVTQEAIQPKEKKSFHLALSRDIILISALSLATVILIIFLLYVMNINSSCKTLALPTLTKEILGLDVSCSQVNIVYVEIWIALLTTIALLSVVIYLAIKKRA